MPEYKLKYVSESEKCQICWDEKNKIWVKVTIEKIDILPADVEKQIELDKEKAVLLREAESHRQRRGK